jgi:hypothetical protein
MGSSLILDCPRSGACDCWLTVIVGGLGGGTDRTYIANTIITSRITPPAMGNILKHCCDDNWWLW